MGTISKLMGGLRSSQDELVDYLIRQKLVKTPRVAEAMRAVDRSKYVNHAYASHTDAYQVSRGSQIRKHRVWHVR